MRDDEATQLENAIGSRRRSKVKRILAWTCIFVLFIVAAFELASRNNYEATRRGLETLLSANRYTPDFEGLTKAEVQQQVRGKPVRREEKIEGKYQEIYRWPALIGRYQLVLWGEVPERVSHVDVYHSSIESKTVIDTVETITDPPAGKGLKKDSNKLVALASYDVPDDGKSLGMSSLTREIIRQGFLIAARDELGLNTRDESLGETVRETDSPEAFPFELRVTTRLRDVGKFKVFYDIEISRPAFEGKPFHWKNQSIKFPETLSIETLVESVEKLSRNEFVTALKDAGFQRQVDREPVPLQLPEGLSEHLDVPAQFATARYLHARIGSGPASTESLGELTRTYAHLGQLTDFHWTPASKAFKARSLLYAQRNLVQHGSTGSTLALRAYARALTGRHATALDDAMAAAGANAPAAPDWLKIIDAYCSYKPKVLEQISGPNRELALYLRMRLSDPEFNEQDALAAIKTFAEVNPACCWTADFLCQFGALGVQRRTTESIFSEVWVDLDARIAQLPELPRSVEQLAVQLADRSSEVTRGGQRKSQMELIRRLQTAGDNGEQSRELSWSILASLLYEVSFVQSWRELNVIVYQLGLEPVDLQVEFYPLFQRHRFEQFLRSFTLDRGVANQSLGSLVNSSVSPCRLEIPTAPILMQIRRQMSMMNEVNIEFHEQIRNRIASHMDLIFDDLWKLPSSRRVSDNSSLEMRKISPFHPRTIERTITQDWRQFQDHLIEWEEQYADNPRILKALADVYSGRSMLSDSIRCLRKSVENAPSFAAYHELAKKIKATGNLDGYRETLELALELPSYGLEEAQVHADLAVFWLQQRDFQKAKEHADIAAATGSAWGIGIASRCSEYLGDWAAAESLRQSISLRYEGSAAEWYFWCVRTGRGNRDEARAHARRYWSIKDSAPESLEHFEHIKYLIVENDLVSALNKLESMYAERTSHVMYLMLTAVVADTLGDASRRDVAFSKLQGGVGFSADITELVNLFKLGIREPERFHWNKHSFDEVIAHAQLHEITFLYFCAGALLENHGEREQGREYLQIAATAFDFNVDFCLFANHFLRSRNVNVGESRTYNFPDEIVPLSRLMQEADREKRERNFDKCIQLMTEALELRPDWTPALLARGQYQVAVGNDAAAKADFEDVLRINPESTAAMTELSWVLATSNRADLRNGPRAIELVQSAIKMREVQLWLSQVVLSAAYAECDQFDKAQETLGNAKNFDDNSHGWAATKLGPNWRKLSNLYKEHKPYRRNPNNPVTTQK